MLYLELFRLHKYEMNIQISLQIFISHTVSILNTFSDIYINS